MKFRSCCIIGQFHIAESDSGIFYARIVTQSGLSNQIVRNYMRAIKVAVIYHEAQAVFQWMKTFIQVFLRKKMENKVMIFKMPLKDEWVCFSATCFDSL